MPSLCRFLPEDVGGGTNTVYEISNSGLFGDSFSTLVIGVPQEAVLGMHTVEGKLVIVNEQLVSRPIVILRSSVDGWSGGSMFPLRAIELTQVATVSI